MKSFGEYRERLSIVEALSPQLQEILKCFDSASTIADDKNMKQTLRAIEDARQSIIALGGK